MNHPSLRVPLVTFGVMFVAALTQLIVFLPLMPEVLASHFDGAGRANGWSTRAAFAGIELGVLLVIGLSFVGIPVLLRRLPNSLFSLPDKSYWLAPERREESLRYLSAALLWFGCACAALMLAVTHLVIRVNIGLEPRLQSGPMWALLVAFLVFTLLWVARLLLRFRVR